MIRNERQYRITKSEAEKFSAIVLELEAASIDSGVHKLIRQAELDGAKSQLESLRAELEEYETLKAGGSVLLESVALDELPLALVKGRISAGISQRELAERLKLKEQQIQRYEATNYAGASFTRLCQVADAIGVKLRKDVFLPSVSSAAFNLFARLTQMGIERDFVARRLLPRSVAEKAMSRTGANDPEVVFRATAVIAHVYGWTPEAIIGTGPLFVGQGVLGAARFKVGARAEQKRLSAYTFYAHFLALQLLEATQDIQVQPVPTDYKSVRRAIIGRYGSITLHNTLNYVWDLGIPVLPLDDPGAFHGAMWRVGGRNVIVVKQQTMSSARWLHDVLHELFHAGQCPEQPERVVLEAAETSEERRESEEEWAATQFAADVVLDGRAEELARLCVNTTKSQPGASGRVEHLKGAVQRVASKEKIAVAALANYMAFRLSQQKLDWWGAAQNLQETAENPWMIARDILLQRAKLGRISGMDLDLMMQALSID